jgi:hypothetical protein
MAANVYHSVDTRTPSKDFAPWVADAPAVQPWLLICVIAPVHKRATDAKDISDWEFDERVAGIGSACLQKDDAVGWAAAQAVGEEAACGSPADYYIVEFCLNCSLKD